MKTQKKLQHLIEIKIEVQQKTRFFESKNNVFESSLTNRDRIKSERLPEVYLHEKSIKEGFLEVYLHRKKRTFQLES